MTGAKPRVEPLDPPMVPFAVAGLAAFAVAALICLLADAPDDWLDTSVAGFLVGIPGLITMIVHDRNLVSVVVKRSVGLNDKSKGQLGLLKQRVVVWNSVQGRSNVSRRAVGVGRWGDTRL